jgi:hypothetical protein
MLDQWYWHKNTHIDHWNRTGDPEINPENEPHNFQQRSQKYVGEKTNLCSKCC